MLQSAGEQAAGERVGEHVTAERALRPPHVTRAPAGTDLYVGGGSPEAALVTPPADAQCRRGVYPVRLRSVGTRRLSSPGRPDALSPWARGRRSDGGRSECTLPRALGARSALRSWKALSSRDEVPVSWVHAALRLHFPPRGQTPRSGRFRSSRPAPPPCGAGPWGGGGGDVFAQGQPERERERERGGCPGSSHAPPGPEPNPFPRILGRECGHPEAEGRGQRDGQRTEGQGGEPAAARPRSPKTQRDPGPDAPRPTRRSRRENEKGLGSSAGALPPPTPCPCPAAAGPASAASTAACCSAEGRRPQVGFAEPAAAGPTETLGSFARPRPKGGRPRPGPQGLGTGRDTVRPERRRLPGPPPAALPLWLALGGGEEVPPETRHLSACERELGGGLKLGRLLSSHDGGRVM